MNIKNPSLQQIFENLEKNVISIRSSEVVRLQFRHLKTLYINSSIEPEFYFSQIRINEKHEGLASDSIFFDNEKVYDVVIGKQDLSIVEIPWSDFTTVGLFTTPVITTKNENNKSIKTVTGHRTRLELKGKTTIGLYYEVSDKEFSDIFDLFQAIKTNI